MLSISKTESEEWLNTAEAAALLGVSEASVRRWGDTGRFPVRRVGARRERRFRRADLGSFKSRDHVAPARPIATPVDRRPRLVAPAHLAFFYDTDAGRMRLSGPFLAEGLAAGEPTFLVASGEVRDAYLDHLSRVPGVDLDHALNTQLLKVLDAPGNTVTSAIAFWEDALWAALTAGATHIRGVGEMVSVREVFVSEGEMLAFEAALNLTVPRFPTVLLCQYDVRHFTGQALVQSLRAHPDLFDQPLGSFLN